MKTLFSFFTILSFFVVGQLDARYATGEDSGWAEFYESVAFPVNEGDAVALYLEEVMPLETLYSRSRTETILRDVFDFQEKHNPGVIRKGKGERDYTLIFDPYIESYVYIPLKLCDQEVIGQINSVRKKKTALQEKIRADALFAEKREAEGKKNSALTTTEEIRKSKEDLEKILASRYPVSSQVVWVVGGIVCILLVGIFVLDSRRRRDVSVYVMNLGEKQKVIDGYGHDFAKMRETNRQLTNQNDRLLLEKGQFLKEREKLLDDIIFFRSGYLTLKTCTSSLRRQVETYQLGEEPIGNFHTILDEIAEQIDEAVALERKLVTDASGGNGNGHKHHLTLLTS